MVDLGTAAVLYKVYLYTAILGGAAFLVQFLLQMIGGDHGDAAEVDPTDLHPEIGSSDISFKFLSVQGLSAFFMMFGLVGMGMVQTTLPPTLSIAGALAAGVLTTWVMGKLFKIMGSLQSDGTVSLENAVGQEGSVYLTIPEKGVGKVEVGIQNRLQVLDAMASSADAIETGERVVVLEVKNNMLVVKKLD